MTPTKTEPRKNPAANRGEPKNALLPVIWSAISNDLVRDADYLTSVVDFAASEGATGFEFSQVAIDPFISYRAYPTLARQVDLVALDRLQKKLSTLSECCHSLGLRFGIWHHEVAGPDGLLDLLPDLRAEDGLINLAGPGLYDFIRHKCSEFFETFPCVDEMVLSLTETDFEVAHRPFCDIPIAERLRRVIQAVADATDAHGRTLVVRPFSAIRSDETHVAEALSQVKCARLEVMYKTDPFDWNPFLPDEDRIGSIPGIPARAETDAGAEYYGQAEFPCCYATFIAKRLESALRRDASASIIRVDRRPPYPSLGTPLNEVNVVAPTRWLSGKAPDIRTAWISWMQERHGACPEGAVELFEQTFDVIRHGLYVNQASLSHLAFPAYSGAKHVLTFALFEENISLDHLPEHWSMIHGTHTLSHAEVIAEKFSAVSFAAGIVAQFETMATEFPPASQILIRESLGRLPLLAEACLRFCRITVAHCREMLGGQALTAPFEDEATPFLALADQIEARFGQDFFQRMVPAMRGMVDGLRRERELEIPIRRELDADPELHDYVLCGFATEMHSISKRLHTGTTGFFADRMVRTTGLGPEEGFGYRMQAPSQNPMALTVKLAGPTSGPGLVSVNSHLFDLPPVSSGRLTDHVVRIPTLDADQLNVWIWSTSTEPVYIAGLELRDA